MTIEIFTQTYNEALILPYFFRHYLQQLQGCDIIFNIYDNGSTDETVAIAKSFGANVIHFETDGVRIDLMMELKNNCWKESKADWVILPDTDEFIMIDKEQLEKSRIDNMFRCYAYEMIGDTTDLDKVIYGVRTGDGFDRTCIFKPSKIKEVNWSMGAHTSAPVGKPCVVWSSYRPILFHMKYFSKEYLKSRYKELAQRLTDIDNKNGWSYHYKFSEKKIDKIFQDLDQRKELVRL